MGIENFLFLQEMSRTMETGQLLLRVHEDQWRVDVTWKPTFEAVANLRGKNAQVLNNPDIEFKEVDGVMCVLVTWEPETFVIHHFIKKYAQTLTAEQVDFLSPASRKRTAGDDRYSATVKRSRKDRDGKISAELTFSSAWEPMPAKFNPSDKLKGSVQNIDHVRKELEIKWPDMKVDLEDFYRQYPDILSSEQYIAAVGELSAKPASTVYDGYSKNGESTKQEANRRFVDGMVKALGELPSGVFAVVFLDAEGLRTLASVKLGLDKNPQVVQDKDVQLVAVNFSSEPFRDVALLPHAKEDACLSLYSMRQTLVYTGVPIASIFLDYCSTFKKEVMDDVEMLFKRRKLADVSFVSLTVSRRKAILNTPDLVFDQVAELARANQYRLTEISRQLYGLMMVLHMECRRDVFS